MPSVAVIPVERIPRNRDPLFFRQCLDDVVQLLRSWPQPREACGDGFLPKRGYHSASLVYQGLQSTGIDSGFSPILLILCRWTNENVAKKRRAQKNPKHTVML
jgi:hypothetical protein